MKAEIKKAETISMRSILSGRKVYIKPFMVFSVFNLYFKTTKLPRSIV